MFERTFLLAQCVSCKWGEKGICCGLLISCDEHVNADIPATYIHYTLSQERQKFSQIWTLEFDVVLLFCPFNAPLVKLLQRFPASYQQNIIIALLNSSFFPLPPEFQERRDTILSTVRAKTRKRLAELTRL